MIKNVSHQSFVTSVIISKPISTDILHTRIFEIARNANFTFIIYFILLSLSLIHSSYGKDQSTCEDSLVGIKNDGSFKVTVSDQFGKPVPKATIYGGIDIETFLVNTDENGIAILPEFASAYLILIFKNNYIPLTDSARSQKNFILQKTSKNLDSIGLVEGEVIRFDEKRIITVDYIGNYRVYEYDSREVKNIFVVQLDSSVLTIKHMELKSDTLWISTHSSGMFAFLLNDIFSPKLLYHFDIEGIIGQFFVRDTILSLIQNQTLRVLGFNATGAYQELSRVEIDFVSSDRNETALHLAIQYLTILSSKGNASVYDISDPYSYKLIYREEGRRYDNAVFYENYLIRVLKPDKHKILQDFKYEILDMSNPASPTMVNSFQSDVFIEGLTSDTSAYGYCIKDVIFSIAEGNINSSFRSVATAVKEGYQGLIENIAGVNPPYYIFKGGLWRLRE